MYFLVSPPIVTIDHNNVTAKVYESVTFMCSATGLEYLSFVWEYNGSVISMSNSTLHQNALIISSVLPQMQGQYKCTVTSSYSNMSSDAITTLHVKGIAIHITTHIFILLSP